VRPLPSAPRRAEPRPVLPPQLLIVPRIALAGERARPAAESTETGLKAASALHSVAGVEQQPAAEAVVPCHRLLAVRGRVAAGVALAPSPRGGRQRPGSSIKTLEGDPNRGRGEARGSKKKCPNGGGLSVSVTLLQLGEGGDLRKRCLLEALKVGDRLEADAQLVSIVRVVVVL